MLLVLYVGDLVNSSISLTHSTLIRLCIHLKPLYKSRSFYAFASKGNYEVKI